jgi:Family of unknown function (DUF5681)
MTKDTKFKQGQSGNPKGKPKGAKDKRTELRELLTPHAEDLVKKAVEKALEGDMAALRLCLDRIIPAIRSKDLPVLITGLDGSLTEQGKNIIESMGDGELSPSDASSMLSALAAQARVVEIDDLEKRVKELEGKNI